MNIFDSHAHLTDEKFAVDVDDVICRASQNHVSGIISVADSVEVSLNVLNLSEKYNWIYPTAGIHPHYAEQVNEEEIEKLYYILRSNKKYVAVGETGLDFYYGKDIKEHQVVLFKKHLDIAAELSLPVIVHCREAEDVILKVLGEKSGLRCLFHCFSGDDIFCRKILEMGFYVSFSGILTFKNSQAIRQAAMVVPLDRILIETDSPYLAPQGYRGKRNEPAYLVNTLESLAEIRKMNVSDMAQITYNNTKDFFSIRD